MATIKDDDANPEGSSPAVPPQWETLRSEGRSAVSRLRLLDFDDLFLLGHLLEGATIAATAKQLGLTQPAITQRVRKIERVFAEPILQKVGRHVRLTKGGRAICVKAADALALMREVTTETAAQSLTIGASPAVAHGWLWPALGELHKADPERLYHCYVGHPDELASLLDAGGLDAVLAPVGPGVPNLGMTDIGDEEFALAAAPELAGSLRTLADLSAATWLEVDRSYPLLARLDSHARAAARFKSVWFLGDVPNVLAAALAGQGVAILPLSLAGAALQTGKLAPVLPELELMPESLRLYYRQDRSPPGMLEALALKLRRG